MTILLARHGNTFGPEDPVVWVGRETDLPLVEKGWRQAQAVGQALKDNALIPDAIVCASLARTRGFAETVARICAPEVTPQVDARLDEVDYGAWARRSTEEIAASHPDAAGWLEAWSRHDSWPPVAAGWGSSREGLDAALDAFIAAVIRPFPVERILLLVSSNGVLRFLPRRLAATDPEGRESYVMKTGHLGVLTRQDGEFAVRVWNAGPAELASRLAQPAGK